MPKSAAATAPSIVYVVGEAGDYEIDPTNYQVKHRGEVRALEPRAFDVMVYLIERRDRIVPKDELFSAFWPPHISASVLSHCVVVARKALGDQVGRQQVIRSMRGRGYRFVGQVAVRARATVSGAAARSAVGETQAQSPSSLVGRAAVMTQLTAAVDQARLGQGRLLLLAGEAGVGKTAVASELARVAAERGARVWSSRGCDDEGTPALWPWIQVLRSAVPELDALHVARLGDGASELAQLLPELRARFSALPARQSLPAAKARFRLFDAVATWLKSAADDQPIVMVLEDLQRADDESLLCLRFVGRELGGSKLLLLGTYCDEGLGPNHPLSVLLGALASESLYMRTTLERFSLDETALFMAQLAGQTVPAAVVRGVHEWTRGNAFFVQEVSRHLLSRGELRGDATLCSVLPQSVREAIEHRLRLLSDDTKTALCTAAVMGPELDVSLLRELLGWKLERVLERLDEASRAGMVAEVAKDTGRFGFSSEVLRAALYEVLPSATRLRIHRRLAEEIEASSEHADERLDELAHHLLRATPLGDASKTVSITLRAAERSFERMAYAESIGHYQRALSLIGRGASPDDASLECQISLRLGRALSISGQREAARSTFLRASELARRLGHAEQLALAGLGLVGPHFWGLPDDALARGVLEAARDLLDERAHPGLLASVLACLSRLSPADSAEQRDASSAHALSLAQHCDSEPALVLALTARHWVLAGPDRVAQRLAITDQLFALSERTHDKMTAAAAHYFRYIDYVGLGQVSESECNIDEFLQLTQKFGTPADQWLVSWAKASRALSQSRLDEAEGLIEAAYRAGQEVQHPGAALIHASHRVAFLSMSGRYDELPVAYEPLLQAFPWARRMQQVSQAYWSTNRSNLAAARADFNALAQHDFVDFARDEHWLQTLWLLGATSARLGDVQRCKQLYELLEPFADRIALDEATLFHIGPVATVLGMLAAALKQWEAAIAHAQASQALCARLGGGISSFIAELEHARILQLRGRSIDRRKAAVMASEVARAASAAGAAYWSERARRLARSLEASL